MKEEPLKTLFLWQGLSPAETEKYLTALKPPAVYEKGTVLYSERSFPHAFAVVLSGKITVRSLSGATMRTLSRGDVFGVSALFGNKRYPTEITVQSRARIQLIEEEQIEKWLKESPAVSLNYIRFLHQRIEFLNERIRIYTEDSTETRLLRYIKEHTAPDGVIRVPGGMAALARELNIGRTSLYRNLETLVKKEKSKRIIINGR